MLKRYQKKKRKYFHRQMHFWVAKPANNKEKMSKNKFSVLIISMCRIYPKIILSFLLKRI